MAELVAQHAAEDGTRDPAVADRLVVLRVLAVHGRRPVDVLVGIAQVEGRLAELKSVTYGVGGDQGDLLSIESGAQPVAEGDDRLEAARAALLVFGEVAQSAHAGVLLDVEEVEAGRERDHQPGRQNERDGSRGRDLTVALGEEIDGEQRRHQEGGAGEHADEVRWRASWRRSSATTRTAR